MYLKSLAGSVYGDKKGRFRDGERIQTSTVEKIVFNEQGEFYAKTKNSTYKLGVMKNNG